MLATCAACNVFKTEDKTMETPTTAPGFEEDVFTNGETTAPTTWPADTEATTGTQSTSPTTGTEATTPTIGTTTPTTGTTPTIPATQPTTKPTTQPTTKPTTQPTAPSTSGSTDTTESTNPPSTEQEGTSMDYERYLNMSAAEKTAFQNTFATTQAFFDWYNAALKAHQEANPPTLINPDGTIVLPTN